MEEIQTQAQSLINQNEKLQKELRETKEKQANAEESDKYNLPRGIDSSAKQDQSMEVKNLQ